LFVSFCFAVRYCLKCFCFLCFTSSVSFTGSYTEVKPKIGSSNSIIDNAHQTSFLIGKQLDSRRSPEELYQALAFVHPSRLNVSPSETKIEPDRRLIT